MNFFEINKKKNATIILINNSVVDDILVCALKEKMKQYSNIGLNMQKVESIKSKEFIELLLNNKFKLFNLQSEVLVYLLLIMKNGFLNSYLNETDFFSNKREFIKRRFLIA